MRLRAQRRFHAAMHMFAFDPKRTSLEAEMEALSKSSFDPIRCVIRSPRGTHMRRRKFIMLLGGTAASAWSVAVRAQQRVRRIAIMLPSTENDPETQARIAAFRQGLEQFGLQEGRNMRVEYSWAAGNPELIKTQTAELVALAPDVILVGITPAVQALKRQTSTIPIVFANIPDPVASGLISSLAKPGGNVTGFTAVEYAIVGKWLGLLKEIAPAIE